MKMPLGLKYSHRNIRHTPGRLHRQNLVEVVHGGKRQTFSLNGLCIPLISRTSGFTEKQDLGCLSTVIRIGGGLTRLICSALHKKTFPLIVNKSRSLKLNDTSKIKGDFSSFNVV